MRTLSHPEARAVYDRVGAHQDRQAWYEDAAVDVLVARGAFDRATAVVEVGCGTGRLAARLLADVLPPGARYLAADPSPVMAALARARLAPFGDRGGVTETFGLPDVPPASTSHVVSAYVIDLLSTDDARQLVDDAHRALAPGGRLCLASLSTGRGASRLVAAGWTGVWRLRPGLVGGCRPVALGLLLDDDRWETVHHEHVAPWGVPSEAVVAVRR